MAGQKANTLLEEYNAERETFFCMLACIKGFSFVWNPQVVTVGLVSKCVGVHSWSVQISPSGFHAVIENAAYAGKWILTYILQMPLCATVTVLLNS